MLSVFTDFADMLAINPLCKVPALELDGLVPPDRRLVPAQEPQRHSVLRVEAVALGLTENLYQRIFEHARRAADKRDDAVVERVERQIASALAWLEALKPSPWLCGDAITIADVSTAIALTYMREKLPATQDRLDTTKLQAHRARCEALDAFTRAAYSASEARRSRWRSETSNT